MRKFRASSLEIREVGKKEEMEFIGRYHKQGYVPSSVAYGLYYGDELLQIETFGKPRIESQTKISHDWELIRECSKAGCIIHGGKSRLLKKFSGDNHPLCLLSYCDTTAGFDGHSYKSCGFFLESSKKEYWYEYNGERISRYRMQKNSSLRESGREPIQITMEKYGKEYDPSLSESENATRAGFVRKEGTGQQVWTKLYSDFVGYVYDFELNGKHYIGQHTLYKYGAPKKSDYWGSGVAWTSALEKYGKKKVVRRILRWYDSEYVMKKMELHWIRKMSGIYGKENMYNIDYTRGACSHLWELDPNKRLSAVEKMSDTLRKKYSSGEISPWNKGRTGFACTEERREKVSASLRKYLSTEDGRRKRLHQLSTICSDKNILERRNESIRKAWSDPLLRKRHSENMLGEKNGFFGRHHSEEVKKVIAEKASEQTKKEIERFHEMGLVTRQDLIDKYSCTKYTWRKKVPKEVLETEKKVGRWYVYSVSK